MILKLTKRLWMLLAIYYIGNFLCGCCISVQAPFYPREAESKGITPSQYGFVFGVFFLSSFIISPFCGKVITQIGAILTSNMGLLIVGVTIILFGILEKIDNPDLFLAFSLITRILEAIGTMAFVIASVSVIATEFPDNIATAFASFESCFGIGLIVGPPIGGILYEWQGYLGPFLLIGVLLLILSISSAILLSQVAEVTNCQESHKGFLFLLKQPEILLGSTTAFGSFLNLSFYQTTLEPHLRPLQLSSLQVGFMFIITGVTYTLASPVWGIICDKCMPPQFVWSIGAILIGVALLLLGPAPYFPFQLSVLLCIFALIIYGIGQAAEMVSSFYCVSRIAIKIGFPDDIGTYGITSALYNAAAALGGFVGPPLGGYLFENIGFAWAVHVLVCFHFSLAIVTLLYNFLHKENLFPKYKNEKIADNELKPILNNTHTYNVSSFTINETSN